MQPRFQPPCLPIRRLSAGQPMGTGRGRPPGSFLRPEVASSVASPLLGQAVVYQSRRQGSETEEADNADKQRFRQSLTNRNDLPWRASSEVTPGKQSREAVRDFSLSPCSLPGRFPACIPVGGLAGRRALGARKGYRGRALRRSCRPFDVRNPVIRANVIDPRTEALLSRRLWRNNLSFAPCATGR